MRPDIRLTTCTLLAVWLLATPPAAQDVDAELATTGTLIAQGHYKDAIDRLTRLQSTADLAGRQSALLHVQLAGAWAETGRHDDALRTADRAEALAAGLSAPDLLAHVEIVRGSVWRYRGFSLRAVEHYKTGLKWAEEAGRPELLASVYKLLSSAYSIVGDWSRVLDYAERAFEAAPDTRDAGRLTYLLQRGIAYYEFHDRDRAAANFQAVLNLAREVGNRRAASLALGELGLVAWEFDRDKTRALAYNHEAIAVARDIGVTSLEATWLNNLGNVYRDTGEWDEALRRYEQAMEVERRTGQERERALLLKNMGQVLLAMGRPAEAEPLLAAAVAQADRLGDRRRQWEARMELGRLHRSGDPALARRHLTESVEILEAVSSNVLLENFRAGSLARALARYDPYDLLIDLLIAQGETAEAFAVAERARARIFLETLSAAREELADAVSPQYLDEEAALIERISAEQARLRSAALAPAERTAAAGAINRDEQALTRLRLRLAIDSPRVAHARYPHLRAASDLQTDVLGDGEALLMFYLGPTGSSRWLLTRDRLEVDRLPPRAEIQAAVGEYLRLLESPSSAGVQSVGARLERLLLGDALAGLPPDGRLIVIPHGILQYLPFEALVDSTGRFLVERHVVSYAPSASSYAFLRGLPRPPASPRVLLVGDPLTQGGEPAAERQVAVEWMHLLKPLPHTREELQAVASIFGRAAVVLDRERASEIDLDPALLQEAAILHFATHALIDEERPQRSGLALSARPPASDGLLQTREIYRLKIQAALVTLSACQTALGQQVSGEGIIGLSRAFFYAGASAVNASLWNVNDASTARWMALFYDEVRAGTPADRAAQLAKLAFLRRDDALSHPYYWAPFVLSGNAAVALQFPSRYPSTPVAIALGAAIVLLAGFGAVWMTRRRKTP